MKGTTTMYLIFRPVYDLGGFFLFALLLIFSLVFSPYAGGNGIGGELDLIGFFKAFVVMYGIAWVIGLIAWSLPTRKSSGGRVKKTLLTGHGDKIEY